MRCRSPANCSVANGPSALIANVWTCEAHAVAELEHGREARCKGRLVRTMLKTGHSMAVPVRSAAPRPVAGSASGVEPRSAASSSVVKSSRASSGAEELRDDCR